MNQVPITISISSIQEDGGLKEASRSEYQGLLHRGPTVTYVRYDDTEGNSNTLRLAPEGVRVYRRGGMQAWQDFRLGEVTGGGLSFDPERHSEMMLRIHTHELVWTASAREGQLALVYDLYTGTSAAEDADPMELTLGRFTLEVAWAVIAS
ncbi:MAG: DUF1934 domain-containing protein [Candidatus Sericytochromatia bacterium]|nr:DUF1934 domain-containing protein [Candidatus Sericytochromatia bacterium]